MKVPYSWLREYCDPSVPPQELAERLAMTGTEVERVATVGPADPQGFVVGRVLEVERHPDADRLNVCRVDTGDAERTIVCGAPNVAAGQSVVVALPGAVMPGGMEIERAKLRGVASEGMICSERELELGQGHEGIMVLDGEAPAPGTPAAEAVPLAEPVLELEVTPNRTDCFGVYGVAREVHAITGAPLAPAPWGPELPKGEAGEVDSLASVSIECPPELCPRFTARAFRDVKVGESPAWLKARLAAAGQRPINNVVDITNYVMLLTAQPMHAYDLDLVPEGALAVRMPRAGEKVRTLDGAEREIPEGTVVIADRDGPAGIAGIMGGAISEVSGSTTTVLMEAANWNGTNILRSSRDLALRSEASSRFEKQLHPALTMRAQALATTLMAELCGALPVPGTIDVGSPPPPDEPVRLRRGRVQAVLGIEIPLETQVEYLERLGFGVFEEDGDLVVEVPPDRFFDVTREIDLVEEVGRVHDLDRTLPATLPSASGGLPGGLSRQQALRRRAEDAMRDAGFDEIVSFSFTDPGEASRLRIPENDPRSVPVPIANPLSEEQSVMRTTLLGSLLGAARRNLSRGLDRVALFESGRIYLPMNVFPTTAVGAGPLGGDFPGERPAPAAEPHHLGALAAGPLVPASWSSEARPADFFAFKGVLEALAGGVGAEIGVAPGEQPFLHPGRSATVLVGGEEAGWIGQLHPLVEREWDLEGAVAFEVELAALVEASAYGREEYRDFASFPPVDRDLAVVVPEAVSAAEVEAAVAEGGGELLDSVAVFDLYRGEQIGAENKSLALRLRFRAPDRTLTDEEVDASRDAILGRVEAIGGRLRA